MSTLLTVKNGQVLVSSARPCPALESPARSRAAARPRARKASAAAASRVRDPAEDAALAVVLIASQALAASSRHRHESPQPNSYIDRLIRGEPAAYEQLVRQHGAMMLAVATRYLRRSHDAEDAVQDALLNAFRAISTFKRESSLVTWLHRIVVNCALMRLRTKRRKPLLTLEEAAVGSNAAVSGRRLLPLSAHDTLEAAEASLILRSRIDGLPAQERQILVLRDLQGLEMAQIAEILAVGGSTAKVALHRSRRRLARTFDLAHALPHTRSTPRRPGVTSATQLGSVVLQAAAQLR